MPSLTHDLTRLRTADQPARPIPTLHARDWAKPLAGGALRVLFVGPYAAMQDCHELTRRFDLASCVVPVTDFYTPDELGVKGFYWKDLEISAEAALTDLRDALAKPWDALAVASLPGWSHYPQDVREAMLHQVQSGATLLVTDLAALEPDLTRLGLVPQPIDAPADADGLDDATIQTHACGQGRLLVTPTSPDPSRDFWLGSYIDRGDYETACARVGHWLASHTLARRGLPGLVKLAVCDAQISLAISPSAIAQDDASDDASSSQPLRARLEVRRQRDDQLMAQGIVHMQSDRTAAATLPDLPDGEYDLSARLMLSDDAVCDWAVTPLRVGQGDEGRSLTPADDGVATLDQPVTLHYEGLAVDGGATVTWQWLDMLGRSLGQGQLTLTESDNETETLSHTVTLPAPAHPLTVLVRLTWAIHHPQHGPRWEGQAMVRFPDLPQREDYPVLFWHRRLTDNWRQRVRSAWLRDHALTDALTNTPVDGVAARAAALEGLRTIPYATWFHRITLDDNLFDDAWLASTEDSARTAAREHRAYGPMAYTLGDEIYVSAFEANGRFADLPRIWQAFQTWLHDRYDNLKAVNAQWGSNHADWASIRFDDELALYRHGEAGNPSAWVDFRQFISGTFTAALRRMRNAIRQEDPGALVGWDGLEHYSSYDGIDLWAICQGMDLIQMYQTKLHANRFPSKLFNGEAVRSFVRRPKLSGMWLNSVERHLGGLMMPWYVLLKGWRSVWWWHGGAPDPVNGAFTWDMQPTPLVEQITRAVTEIRQCGAAALLTRAEPVFSPIAIHYSEANWHASTIESGIANHQNNLGVNQELWRMTPLVGREAPADDTQRTLWGDTQPSGHYGASSRTFHLMLRDVGHQPQTVADAQWNPSTLRQLGVKMLILPFTCALSDEEVQVIRDFVKQGGCVIADYRAGLRDEHGKPRTTGALDDLFGLERDTLEVNRQDSQVTFDLLHQAAGRVASTFHDPIRLTTAKAMGHHADGTPALLVNTVGQGKAVYLNMALNDYHLWRKQGTQGIAMSLMHTLCHDLAGIPAPVTLRDELSRPIDGAEVMTFQSRGVTYVGIHPDPYVAGCPTTQAMVVTLPRPGHVYDIRRHESLGHGRSLTLTLDRRESILLAVLPEPVGRFHASAPSAWPRGRELAIHVALDAPASSDRFAWACRMDVQGPDGQPVAHYSQSVALDQFQGTLVIPFALNDPAGPWRITLTQTYTGQRQTLLVHLDGDQAD